VLESIEQMFYFVHLPYRSDPDHPTPETRPPMTQQIRERWRLKPVMTPSRSVVATLVARVALMLLAGELILGLLPAVIRAVASAT
jgi:hypothetical protein